MSRIHPFGITDGRGSQSRFRLGIASSFPLIARTILLTALVLTIPFRLLASENAVASPALGVFEAFQKEIASAVSDSRLSPEIAAMAEDLRLDLQRDLIRIEAEIEVLRLDVSRSSGARQKESLDLLIDEVGRREKRIYDQIQRLEILAGMPGCLAAESEEGETENEAVRLNLSWEPEEFVDDVQP